MEELKFHPVEIEPSERKGLSFKTIRTIEITTGTIMVLAGLYFCYYVSTKLNLFWFLK